MATPEFRWPMTTMMALSAMMFFALDTPTSGLAWSSYGTSSTLKPVFSRLPLNFSMASCVPSLMPSPSAALAAAERALRGDLDGALPLCGRPRPQRQEGDGERRADGEDAADACRIHRLPP